MGPAPTRVPRLALPPAIDPHIPNTMFMALKMPGTPCGRRTDFDRSSGDLDQETQPDDTDEPEGADEQRRPVEVLPRHAGARQARLHAATEQGGQTAAPPTVQQDQQNQ